MSSIPGKTVLITGANSGIVTSLLGPRRLQV